MSSIRDIILGKAKKKKRSKRAIVCVDAANLHRFSHDNKTRIDWEAFKSLMESIYSSVDLYYYDGTATAAWLKNRNSKISKENIDNYKKRQKLFFNKLRQFGYKVITKPIAQIYNKKDKNYIYKCNLDVEITIDVMENIDKFDVLVLVSGDGDFIAIVKRLKYFLKETHVIAPESRMNSELKKKCASYDYINNLLWYVKDLKEVKKRP